MDELFWENSPELSVDKSAEQFADPQRVSFNNYLRSFTYHFWVSVFLLFLSYSRGRASTAESKSLSELRGGDENGI